MFGKPKCKRCSQKVSKKYYYCPYCGTDLKGDAERSFEPMLNLGFPFNMLVKQIEKQFQEIDSQLGNNLDKALLDSGGISINIDTSSGQPAIRIRTNSDQKGPHPQEKERPARDITKIGNISEDKLHKFSHLPKEEPSTKVRRFSNRLVYELTLPGVKSENIVISKLENSIEIKAFADNKAFFKLIPISLPILKSDLKDGLLTLELKV